MTKLRPLSALLARLANRDGAAAVEFAILAPILALVLAGAVDFGGVVFVKFGLDNTVSSASNYAINGRASVNGTAGGTLANTMGAILTNSGTSPINGSIIVNNGPRVTITNGATSAPAATAANANSCYCPTLLGTAVAWGTSATCGSACATDGQAGKFVAIEASRQYTPLFSDYGFIDDNKTVTVRAVVQTE